MSLNIADAIVLQEIIDVEGDCLDGIRCTVCPFRGGCLPEFLLDSNKRPTKNQRFQMALDVIVKNTVLEDSENLYDRKDNEQVVR